MYFPTWCSLLIEIKHQKNKQTKEQTNEQNQKRKLAHTHSPKVELKLLEELLEEASASVAETSPRPRTRVFDGHGAPLQNVQVVQQGA